MPLIEPGKKAPTFATSLRQQQTVAGLEGLHSLVDGAPELQTRVGEGLANQFDEEFVSFVRGLPPHELAADDFSYDWMMRGLGSTAEAAGAAGVQASERAAAQQADAAGERGMAGEGPARS